VHPGDLDVLISKWPGSFAALAPPLGLEGGDGVVSVWRRE